MKVLFDSNVHVSAAVYGGAGARAVRVTLRAHWKVFISEFILDETRRIIRDKFGRSPAIVNSTIDTLSDVCEIVEEQRAKHHVPGDPNDTPILRAALAAGVDYLVTRDAELLALNPTESVRISTLAEYLHILEDHGYALD